MTHVRLPTLAPEAYSEAQKQAAQVFAAQRGAPVFGPFGVLIRSPEVMTHASALGEYLRYRSAIGTRLSELAILVVARQWTQDYEWSAHAPIALKVGIAPAIVEAIADGRRPEGMGDDEAVVHDFSIELQRNRRVSDVTYGRALALFGEQGVIDLTAINGYYSLLAMTMNVARTPIPENGTRLPRLPE